MMYAQYWFNCILYLVVFVIGETPASFVCQGVIDFLVSQHPIARVLRDYIIFKIVPMLNPDGVVLGNYRSSLMGFDLNRHWHEPSTWAHPSIVATKELILTLDEDKHYDLDFFIDIHAHSTLTNGFIYGNVYDNEERFERQMIFPRLLFANAEDFSLVNTSFNRDAVKAGTGRRYLGNALDQRAHCYTLEVSFASYTTTTTTAATTGQEQLPYTEELYLKLGRNVARTFLDFYKLDCLLTTKIKRPFLTNRTKQTSDETYASGGHQYLKPRGSHSVTNTQSTFSSNDSSNGTLKLTHRKSK